MEIAERPETIAGGMTGRIVLRILRRPDDLADAPRRTIWIRGKQADRGFQVFAALDLASILGASERP